MLKSSDVIKLTKVKFSYASGAIFENLSVGFPKAKVTAVMGGSGSGKTTILKLIGGQIKPKSGDVSYCSENINQLNYDQLFQFRRKLGMLFQFGALFTDLNVFDNVAFPLREQSSLPEVAIRDLVLLKLHTVGLRGASKLMPSELSGGMARRVALARAIALDPEVMLYDEPFTGLDPISTAITGDLIRRLNNALGITSIFVTHDIKASFKVADEVVLLSRGQVTARGTPRELIESQDPFVRQFVGGEVDGPVPFHVASENIANDLGIPVSKWLKNDC
jgi:phospholipid/cholesterol/gamma-HCH transport system ATP-binding protein